MNIISMTNVNYILYGGQPKTAGEQAEDQKRLIINSKGATGTAPAKEDPKILVPECYTRGRCGPTVGFCDGNRFCNAEGKCGSGDTHKPDIEHNNFKYRLCKGENDTGCIKTAMCGADEKYGMKCRLVFSALSQKQ